MNVRLRGTRDECEQALARLAAVLLVVSVSDPHPDRGRSILVRVYLDVRLEADQTNEGAELGGDVPEQAPHAPESDWEVVGDG